MTTLFIPIIAPLKRTEGFHPSEQQSLAADSGGLKGPQMRQQKQGDEYQKLGGSVLRAERTIGKPEARTQGLGEIGG